MSVIRSSQSYLFDLIRTESSRMGRDVNTLKEQAVTGRKVNRPSDAPASMGKIVRIREEAANQESISYDDSVQEQASSSDGCA